MHSAAYTSEKGNTDARILTTGNGQVKGIVISVTSDEKDRSLGGCRWPT